MRVGFVVHVYNHAMRRRRRELQMSQVVLSELSRVPLADVGAFESLRMVRGDVWDVCRKMKLLADALDIEQSELFPADYLAATQACKLPRRHIPFEFVREVPMSSLIVRSDLLALPDPTDDTDCLNPIPEEIVGEIVGKLSPRHRDVINMRYGLLDGKSYTLEEVGKKMGVTRSRVLQIEASALRQMRGMDGIRKHPHILESLQA